MNSIHRIALVSVAAFLVVAVGCKKDEENDPSEFDKGTLLVNLADQRIIPAINDLNSKLESLEGAYLNFQTDRSTPNLDLVRTTWKAAYISWQGVKMYDFGPVRTYGLKAALSTYPSDTAKIDANISGGSYVLSSAANIDAIGFPALDYLLFRSDALNYFIGNDGYTTYGLDVIQKMRSEVALAQSGWASYRATFIASTGTETTSAFSELVNEFNRDFELAKNAKLGIPIGKQSLGIQLPEYLEARYSGYSFELMRENVRQLSLLYSGISFDGGTNGSGFDDYLTQLEKSDLASAISGKFDQILAKIDSFNGSLEEEMQNNVSELDALYFLFQSQVISIKTDMTSAFGVLITYQDNDGD